MKLKHILPTVMTCIAICAFSAAQALLASLATRIAATFGHGLGWSGFFFAACYIPYIVIGPFAGRLVSALGRHFSISLAIGICAVSAVLMPYANRFHLVCLCLALLGAGGVFSILAGVEAICALTGRPHAQCLTLCATVLGFGAVPGAFCAGFLTGRGCGWQNIFFWFGIAVAVIAVFHALIPFPRLPAVESEDWQDEMRSALRVRRMYPCFFAAFLYAGAEIIASCWIAAYLIDSLGYTTVIASYAVTLIWACAGAGRLLCSRLAEKVTPQFLSVLLLLVLVLSLSLCAVVADGRLFWFAVCGVGLGLSGVWALLLGAGIAANDGGSATLAALFLWYSAGAAMVSLCAGGLGSAVGMRTVLVFGILLFLVNYFMMRNVFAQKRRKVPAHPAPREEPSPQALKMKETLQVMREFGDFENFDDLEDYDVFEDYVEYDEEDYDAPADTPAYEKHVDYERLTAFEEDGYFESTGVSEEGEVFADFADLRKYTDMEPFAEQESFDDILSADGQERFGDSLPADEPQRVAEARDYDSRDPLEDTVPFDVPEPFRAEAAPVEGQIVFEEAVSDGIELPEDAETPEELED